MSFCRLALVLTLLNLLVAETVRAQRPMRRRAVTERREVDADYAFVGEYLGQVAVKYEDPEGPQRPLGMQVIAMGNGRFKATAYRGGLPGNGWDKSERFQLEGQSHDKALTLTFGDLQVEINDVFAHVKRPDDVPLGSLRKVIRTSSTLGKQPPPGAIVLFDGRHVDAFKRGRVKEGLLQVGTEVIPTFRNYTMHIEFLVPYMPDHRSQGRANSGVYLQSRYEVQILDSFGLEGKKNECGGIYRYRAPDQNMAFPPLTWQTYDITFNAPCFDRCGNKIRNARITVLHNGVPVHANVPLENKTGAGQQEGPNPLPIKLQDHGNPVQFRNIWIVDHQRQYRRGYGRRLARR